MKQEKIPRTGRSYEIKQNVVRMYAYNSVSKALAVLSSSLSLHVSAYTAIIKCVSNVIYLYIECTAQIYSDREVQQANKFHSRRKYMHTKIYECKRMLKQSLSPLTGRGGLYDCEKLRIPHWLYNPLTDGDEVVSLTHRP
jgi:hypothetical protein